MDLRTTKLLQQAGKFVLLGKLGLALEQYLKIHQLDPQDTTIINTIGDLYLRLGKEHEALLWYQKLAEVFESRGLLANTTVIYKKILKLSPQNQAVMTRLAQLYEQQGQIASAKAQYKLMADHLSSLGQYEQAIAFYQSICRLDPNCADSRFGLAQVLEKSDRREESSQAYLQGAELLVKKGQLTAAASVVEGLFRLKPRNKELVKSFFRLLRQVDLTDRGVEYLQSLSLDKDPDIRVMLGEVFLQDGKLDLARKYLLGEVPVHPRMYPVCLKLMRELITRKEVSVSLAVVDALFETSVQLHDEVTLKVMLDSLLELDESNLRVLKMLVALMIRIGDRPKLEEYFKRLVILQLQSGNLPEARDNLKQMVVYGQSNLCLDLLNRLNEAMVSGSSQDVRETCEKVIRVLEGGTLESPGMSGIGLALGVSEADLGAGLAVESQDDL